MGTKIYMRFIEHLHHSLRPLFDFPSSKAAHSHNPRRAASSSVPSQGCSRSRPHLSWGLRLCHSHRIHSLGYLCRCHLQHEVEGYNNHHSLRRSEPLARYVPVLDLRGAQLVQAVEGRLHETSRQSTRDATPSLVPQRAHD